MTERIAALHGVDMEVLVAERRTGIVPRYYETRHVLRVSKGRGTVRIDISSRAARDLRTLSERADARPPPPRPPAASPGVVIDPYHIEAEDEP